MILNTIVHWFMEDVQAAPEGAAPSTSGVWSYIVSIGPVVALILTPILGWLVSRKKDKPTQEQGIIQEVQEERAEMKAQRDAAIATNKELNGLLEQARAKILEFEELMVKTRIEKMEMTQELAEAKRINTALNAQLELQLHPKQEGEV
jgi:uncharacterized membrane protein